MDKLLTPGGVLLALTLLGCTPPVPEEIILSKAQEVVKTIKETYADTPVIEAVRLESFGLLDPDYYREKTAELERLGFRWVGDIEYKHLTAQDLALKTCIRVGTTADGTIHSAVWHLHAGPRLPRDVKAVELTTEFSDGHWVSTLNLPVSGLVPDPERVTLWRMPSAGPAELLERQRSEIEAYGAAHPAAQLVAVRTLAEVIAQQERQVLQEAQYRRQVHGLNESELRRLAPELSGRDVRRLLAEIQKNY